MDVSAIRTYEIRKQVRLFTRRRSQNHQIYRTCDIASYSARTERNPTASLFTQPEPKSRPKIFSLAASPDLVSDTCRGRAIRLCSNHQQRSRAISEFCKTLTGFEDVSIRHFACRVGAIARRNTAEFPVAVPTGRKSRTPYMIHRTGGAIAIEEEV